MKPTPIPWRIANIPNAEHFHIIAGTGNSRCFVAELKHQEGNDQANAEFIVRAVNSHEMLLEACRKALPYVELNPALQHNIEQAIKRATEGKEG